MNLNFRKIKHRCVTIVLILLTSINIADANTNVHSNLVFAYDQYLDFPVTDPLWQKFFEKNHIKLVAYTNMDQLVQDLKKNTIAFSFIPAGALYYLRNDKNYQGIASATLGQEKGTQLTSYLVVKKDSKINSIDQLRNKNLAYINFECTTSYFAPLLYLNQNNGIKMTQYFNLIPFNGFFAQMDAIANNKNITATMIWDIIWLHSGLAEKTKIIGKVSNLPTPVVIANVQINNTLIKEMQQELLLYQLPKSQLWKFSGFISYQKQQNQEFWRQINNAKLPG